MALAARVVDEMDDDDEIDGATSLPQRPDNDLPPGLSGNPPPAERQQQARQPQEPQFEVVETDDRFHPIQRQEQPLTEEAAPVDPNAVQPGAERDEFGRPRITRSERNRRRRVYQERLEGDLAQTRQQLEALQAQLGGIEPRLTELDQGRRADQLAGLDRQINEANARAALARNNLTEALTNNDPAAITAALDMRDESIRQAERLSGQKERLTSAAPIQTVDPNQFRQPQPQRQAPAPLPREAAMRATEFQNEHPWLAQNPGSREARLLLDIDNEVAAEGFDPRTPDYWDEVRDRAGAYMDLRTGRPLGQANGNGQPRQQPRPGAQPMPQQQQVLPQRRGPMVAGGSANGGGQESGRKLFLSPDRKQAMIQVGALEPDGRTIANRQKYTRLAERYMAFDRDNAPA